MTPLVLDAAAAGDDAWLLKAPVKITAAARPATERPPIERPAIVRYRLRSPRLMTSAIAWGLACREASSDSRRSSSVSSDIWLLKAGQLITSAAVSRR